MPKNDRIREHFCEIRNLPLLIVAALIALFIFLSCLADGAFTVGGR